MLYIFSGSLYRTFENFETNLKTLKNEQVKLSSAVDLLDTVHVNGKKKTSTVNQGRIYKQELHLSCSTCLRISISTPNIYIIL